MGLDLHVMPLSRFLTGNFQSPLEQLLGDRVERVGTAKPSSSREESLRFVSSLQDRLRPVATGEVTWDEKSESVFSEQFDGRARDALAAFAAYQEYPKMTGLLRKRVAPFSARREIEEASESHGLGKVIQTGAPTTFPHLIRHRSNDGFYLPVDFPNPIPLSEQAWNLAGSSIRLLDELDRLGRILGMTHDWAQLADGARACADDDALSYEKYAWAVLHAAARLSVEHRLPIIFDG